VYAAGTAAVVSVDVVVESGSAPQAATNLGTSLQLIKFCVPVVARDFLKWLPFYLIFYRNETKMEK
jgi:hypothetical protein